MIVDEIVESKQLNSTAVRDMIARRWSPTAFSARPVETEKLRSLFEAPRWVPSSYNQQPWSFILATRDNPTDYDRLLSVLVDRNAAWARSAPVLMLSVAKLHFDYNGLPNRHAFHDVGQSVAYLALAATELRHYLHQMAGF